MKVVLLAGGFGSRISEESVYWIELLHRNNYIDDKQFDSIYADCEELVRILVTRCKKLNDEIEKK